MSDFTQSEILNEVAKIFRARLSPGREGGTLNTATEYSQLLELASTTFLLNNDAIFYIALLVRNRLQSLVNREIKYIEDMLVSLDDLSQIGKAVRDTATLNNANTALLALDAADSVSNRPETTRFLNLMDKFSEQYRANIQSSTTGGLVRPREDARGVLRKNLENLKTTHDRVIAIIFALRDLLVNFVALDIPSRVSSTAFTSIREGLNSILNDLETTTDTENIAKSRQTLLTTLASKSAVNLISTFTDPRDLKIRTPINPIPSGISSLGRVTGEGEPAKAITREPGPWKFPISGDLGVRINGGASQTVVLSGLVGAVLNGRNEEDFEVTVGGGESIHVVVDPNRYSDVVWPTHSDTNTCHIANFIPLGFKHLGATVTFPDKYLNLVGPQFTTDGYSRAITELRQLKSGSISGYVPDPGGDTGTITVSALVAVQEPGIVFTPDHVGGYFLQFGNRWEIIEYISTNMVSVAVTDLAFPPVPGVFSLHGETPAANSPATGTRFDFQPALSVSLATQGSKVTIDPATKTSLISFGTRSVADIVAQVATHVGLYDDFGGGSGKGQSLNQHVKVSAVVGDPTRISLSVRSRKNPYMRVSNVFPRAKVTPGELVIVGDSLHEALGFRLGETDSTDTLTPAELAGQINNTITNGIAEILSTQIATGTALASKQNLAEVEDASVNFDNITKAGDQIVISGGQLTTGTFQILSVSGSTLVLDRVPFTSKETNLVYTIVREQVQVVSNNKERGTSVEITSTPAELDFPTNTQYGILTKFEAVDKLGNLLDFAGIRATDLLRLTGSSILTEVVAVDGAELELVSGLPSNTEGVGFEIRSGSSKQYLALQDSLTTYTTSPSLLPKNKFDENLDAVDAALTSALLPGQNFVSSRNRARQVLGELLSILTDEPRRGDEYTATIPTAPLNLEDILAGYSVPAIVAIDKLLDAFAERKYNRAVRLMQAGKIQEFFTTNEETGSFGGNLLSSSRSVVDDLPAQANSASVVDRKQNLAQSADTVPDAEEEFDDFETSSSLEIAE